MQSVDCAKRIALEENRKKFEKHDCELRTIFSNLERNLMDEKRDLLTYASNFQSKVECSKKTKVIGALVVSQKIDLGWAYCSTGN
jgi:hypothetical protein